MSEVSVQDAAFTGFRIVRAHPRALIPWALLGGAASISVAVVFVALLGSDAQALMALNARQPRDLGAMQVVLVRMAPGYLALLVTALAFNAVLAAGLIRAVLRPGQDRFGYLRLGADEARQFALSIYTSLVFLGLYVLGAVLIGLVVALASGAQAVSPFLAVVTVLALLAALLWLAVRLSLAPPLTFDTGRIALFGSWALTRGRFLPLLGVYALAAALAAVVYFLSELVVMALSVLLSGGDVSVAREQADMSSLAAYFTPFRLIQTVLGACASSLVWPVIFTPAAAVYRSLRGGPSASAQAFS